MLLQISILRTTHFALEIGKLYDKQNNRKRKTKNLLFFCSHHSIHDTWSNPILLFFIQKNLSWFKFFKKCLPIHDSSKILLMCVTWKKIRNVVFNLHMRCLHTYVFTRIHISIHTHFYSFLVLINSKKTFQNIQHYCLRNQLKTSLAFLF